MKIQNSVAFVTGANRGLGLPFVHELLTRVAKKVYAGVRDPASTDLPNFVAIRLDVTDANSVAAADLDLTTQGDFVTAANSKGSA
jgi:NAD(P)-dependent dehydrogenase (short-subunit alcohol dehydrogenase family)